MLPLGYQISKFRSKILVGAGRKLCPGFKAQCSGPKRVLYFYFALLSKVVFHVQNGLSDRPHAAVMVDDFQLSTGACSASSKSEPFEPGRDYFLDLFLISTKV